MGESYQISLSRRLRESAERAFAVVEDVERFPEFMPNVNALTVLESDENRKVAALETTIDDAPLNWIEEGVYDRENLLVQFRALDGVFDRFDGSWRVARAGTGSLVEFELEYEIGLPEIEYLVAPILRERLIENVESMLTAIEQRVDGTDHAS